MIAPPRDTAVAVVVAVAGGVLIVVVAAAEADRSALDRELTTLAERLDGPGVRELRPERGDLAGVGTVIGSSQAGQGGSGDGDGTTTYGPPAGLPPGGRGGPGGRGRGGPPPTLDPGSDRFARVVSLSGVAISQGTAVPASFPLPEPSQTPKSVEAGGEDWRTITRSLPGGRTLQVAARLEPLQDDARRLQLIVLAALAGALLLTALLTRTLTRIALGPLERLRGTAEEVASTADPRAGRRRARRRSTRSPATSTRCSLGSARSPPRAAPGAGRARAASPADAGHELRTPLTSLEANLATGAVGPAREDARRLTALVEQLQALARGEAGPPARPESVDLAELADAAIVDLRRRHPEVGATLDAPASGAGGAR